MGVVRHPYRRSFALKRAGLALAAPLLGTVIPRFSAFVSSWSARGRHQSGRVAEIKARKRGFLVRYYGELREGIGPSAGALP